MILTSLISHESRKLAGTCLTINDPLHTLCAKRISLRFLETSKRMKCFPWYEWICENSIPPNHRVAELFQTIRNKVPCGSFSRFVNVVTGIFSMFTTWWAAICENVKFVWNDASTSIVVTRVEAIRPMPYNLDQVLISGVSKKKLGGVSVEPTLHIQEGKRIVNVHMTTCRSWGDEAGSFLCNLRIGEDGINQHVQVKALIDMAEGVLRHLLHVDIKIHHQHQRQVDTFRLRTLYIDKLRDMSMSLWLECLPILAPKSYTESVFGSFSRIKNNPSRMSPYHDIRLLKDENCNS